MIFALFAIFGGFLSGADAQAICYPVPKAGYDISLCPSNSTVGECQVYCASGYHGAPTVSCLSTGTSFVISGCTLGCGQPDVGQTQLTVSFDQKALVAGNDYVLNLSLYFSGGIPYSGCVNLLEANLAGPMALKSELSPVNVAKGLYSVKVAGGLIGSYTLNLAANGQQYANTSGVDRVFVVTQHATPANMSMSLFYMTAAHVGLTTSVNFQLRDKYGNNYLTSDPSLSLTTNVSGTSTAMAYVSDGLYRASMAVSSAVGTYTAGCFNSTLLLKTTSYTVRAGTVSASNPGIAGLNATVYLGQTEWFTLQLKDAAGNPLTQPLATNYSLSYSWTGPGAVDFIAVSLDNAGLWNLTFACASSTQGVYSLTINLAVSGQSGTSQVFAQSWTIMDQWDVLGPVSMSSRFLYTDSIMSGKVAEFIVTADNVGGGIAYQPCIDVVYRRGQAFGDLYNVSLEGYSGEITYTCLGVNSTGKIVHPYSNQLVTGLAINATFCSFFLPVSSFAASEQELKLRMFSLTDNAWLIANAASGAYTQTWSTRSIMAWGLTPSPTDWATDAAVASAWTSTNLTVTLWKFETWAASEVLIGACDVAQQVRLTLQLPPTYAVGKVVIKQYLPPNVAWTAYRIVDHNGTLRMPTTMPGGGSKNDTAQFGISVLGLGIIADPVNNTVSYETSNVTGPASGNALEVTLFYYVPRLNFYGQNTTSDWEQLNTVNGQFALFNWSASLHAVGTLAKFYTYEKTAKVQFRAWEISLSHSNIGDMGHTGYTVRDLVQQYAYIKSNQYFPLNLTKFALKILDGVRYNSSVTTPATVDAARYALLSYVVGVRGTVASVTLGTWTLAGSSTFAVDNSDIGNDTEATTWGKQVLRVEVGQFNLTKYGYILPVCSRMNFKFKSTILEKYTDTFLTSTNNVGGEIVQADTLGSEAEWMVRALDVAKGTCPAQTTTVSKVSSSFDLTLGAWTIGLYGVNGMLGNNNQDCPQASVCPTYFTPGQLVTFNYTYVMPQTDFWGFSLSAPFKLPMFLADFTGFDYVFGAGFPAVKRCKYGPADTLGSYPQQLASPLSFSVDAGENAADFTYANSQDVNSSARTVQLMCTVKVSYAPYYDMRPLITTGIATEHGQTRYPTPYVFAVAQPMMKYTGTLLIGVSNSEGIHSLQAGQARSYLSTVCTTAGKITVLANANRVSDVLLTSSLMDATGHDLLSQAVLFENQGSGNVYRLSVVRPLNTACFREPDCGFNLVVTDGRGASLAYTGDLFNGLTITEMLGTINASKIGQMGNANVLVVTYDVELVLPVIGSSQLCRPECNLPPTITSYYNSPAAAAGNMMVATEYYDVPTVNNSVPSLCIKPPAVSSKVLNISCDNTLNDNTVTFGVPITYEVNVSFPEISVEPAFISQTFRVGSVTVPVDILSVSAFSVGSALSTTNLVAPTSAGVTFPVTTSSDLLWKLADRVANPLGATTNNVVSWRVTVILKDNPALVDGGVLRMETKVGAGAAANVISSSTVDQTIVEPNLVTLALAVTFPKAGSPDAGEKGKLTMTVSETEGNRNVLYRLATEASFTRFQIPNISSVTWTCKNAACPTLPVVTWTTMADSTTRMYAVWPSTTVWCLDNTTKKCDSAGHQMPLVGSVDFVLSPNISFSNTMTNNASVFYNGSVCQGYTPRSYRRDANRQTQTEFPRVTLTVYNTSDPSTSKSQYSTLLDDLAVGEIATVRVCTQMPEGRSSSVTVQVLLPNAWWVIQETHRNLTGPLSVGNGLEIFQASYYSLTHANSKMATINFGAVDTSRFSNETMRGRDYLEVCFLVDVVPAFKTSLAIAQNQLTQAVMKSDSITNLRAWDVASKAFTINTYVDLVQPSMTHGVTYSFNHTAWIPATQTPLAQAGDLQNFTVTITNVGMSPCYDIVQVTQLPTWLSEIVGTFPGGVTVSYPPSTFYVTTKLKQADLPYSFSFVGRVTNGLLLDKTYTLNANLSCNSQGWENTRLYGPPVPPGNFSKPYVIVENYQYGSAVPEATLFSGGSCLGAQGPSPLYTSTSGKSLVSASGQACGAFILSQTTTATQQDCQGLCDMSSACGCVSYHSSSGVCVAGTSCNSSFYCTSSAATVFSRGSTRVVIGEVFDLSMDLWMPFGSLPPVSVDVSFGGALVAGRVVVQSATVQSLRPGFSIVNPVTLIGAMSDCHSGICGDSVHVDLGNLSHGWTVGTYYNNLSTARLVLQVLIANVASNSQGSDILAAAKVTYANQFTSIDSMLTYTVVESTPNVDFFVLPVPTAREGGDFVTYTANFRNDGLANLYSVLLLWPIPLSQQVVSYPAGGSVVAQTLNFVYTNLAPGANGSFTFTTKLLDSVPTASQITVPSISISGNSHGGLCASTSRSFSQSKAANATLETKAPYVTLALKSVCGVQGATSVKIGEDVVLKATVVLPRGTSNLPLLFLSGDYTYPAQTSAVINKASYVSAIVSAQPLGQSAQSLTFGLPSSVTRDCSACSVNAIEVEVHAYAQGLPGPTEFNGSLTYVGITASGAPTARSIQQELLTPAYKPRIVSNFENNATDFIVGTIVRFVANISHHPNSTATAQDFMFNMSFDEGAMSIISLSVRLMPSNTPLVLEAIDVASTTPSNLTYFKLSQAVDLAVGQYFEVVLILNSSVVAQEVVEMDQDFPEVVFKGSYEDTDCPTALSTTNSFFYKAIVGYPEGVYRVCHYAQDFSSNEGECCFNVTLDITPPSIVCPKVVVPTDNNLVSYATVNYLPPTVSDTFLLNASSLAMSPYVPQGLLYTCCFENAKVATFSVSDVAGNKASCNYTVTVYDPFPPRPFCSNITLYTEPGRADVVYNANLLFSSIDNVDPSPNKTYINPTTRYNLTLTHGVTSIVFTSCDRYGNCANCTSYITVIDQEPPVLVCPPNMTVPAAEHTNRWIGLWDLANATDNHMVLSILSAPPRNSTFVIGSYLVTQYAYDPSGNMGSCAFNLTIIDTQPPIPLFCPTEDIVLPTDPFGNNYSTATWPTIRFTDNHIVKSLTAKTYTPGTRLLALRTYTVVYEAVDMFNNTAICDFNVTVIDVEPPFINCLNLSVPAQTGGFATVDTSIWKAFDNVNISTNYSIPAFSQTYPIGTHYFTIYANDTSGNLFVCPVSITVTPRCGDGVLSIGEECDGGDFCNVTCKCPRPQYVPSVPPGPGCTQICVDTPQKPCNAVNAPLLECTRKDLGPYYTAQYTAGHVVTWDIHEQFNISGNFTVVPLGQEVVGKKISLISEPASGTLLSVGTHNITIVAYDGYNYSFCYFLVQVKDGAPPLLSNCPAGSSTGDCGHDACISLEVDVDVDENGLVTYVYDYATWFHPIVTRMDYVDKNPSLVITGLDDEYRYSIGKHVISWFSKDWAGHNASCDVEITVVDLNGPSVDCDDLYIGTTPGLPTGLVPNAIFQPYWKLENGVWTGLGMLTWPVMGMDVVDGPINTTVTPDPYEAMMIGQHGPFEYCAVNSINIQRCCQANITVIDTEKPVIECPTQPIVFQATGVIYAGTWTIAVTDNDPDFTVFHNASVTTACELGSCLTMQASLPLGTHYYYIRAQDTNPNNTVTCNYTVVVVDIGPPVITCPANMLFNITNNATAVTLASLPAPAITDNSGVVLTAQVKNPNYPACLSQGQCTAFLTGPHVFRIGSSTVCYVASDLRNNTAECCFVVEVRDRTPPTVFECPVSFTAPSNWDGTWSAPHFYDNVGVTVITTSHPPAVIVVGVNTVWYKAVDAAGNVAWCNFTLTKPPPNTPPVIPDCPAQNVTLTLANYGTVWTGYQIDLTAFDAETATNDLVWSPVPASTYHNLAQGITVLQYTVTDEGGLSAECNVTVEVVVRPPPTITCQPDQTFRSHDGQPVEVCYGSSYYVLDNNNKPVSVSVAPPSCTLFPVQSKTTVTVLGKDVICEGNLDPRVRCGLMQATCTFNIIIKPPYPDVDFSAVLVKSIVHPVDENGDGIFFNDYNENNNPPTRVFGVFLEFMTGTRNPHKLDPSSAQLTLTGGTSDRYGNGTVFLYEENCIGEDDGSYCFQTWYMLLKFNDCAVVDQTMTTNFLTMCTPADCYYGSRFESVTITYRAESYCEVLIQEIQVSATLETYQGAAVDGWVAGGTLPAPTQLFNSGETVGAVVEASSTQVKFQYIAVYGASISYYYSAADRDAGTNPITGYDKTPVYLTNGAPTADTAIGASFGSVGNSAAWFKYVEDVLATPGTQIFPSLSATIGLFYQLGGTSNVQPDDGLPDGIGRRRRALLQLVQRDGHYDGPEEALRLSKVDEDEAGRRALAQQTQQLDSTSTETKAIFSLVPLKVAVDSANNAKATKTTVAGMNTVFLALAIVVLVVGCIVCVGCACMCLMGAKANKELREGDFDGGDGDLQVMRTVDRNRVRVLRDTTSEVAMSVVNALTPGSRSRVAASKPIFDGTSPVGTGRSVSDGTSPVGGGGPGL